jgi:hypothetical protein
MNFLETHFEDYVKSSETVQLHPSLKELYEKTFPKSLLSFKNVIFYGPSGVGKYSQMLTSIKKYSPSSLKYEKKITIQFNKCDYYFKVSDIHYEIDMSLLGCNSKMLWNEMYNQIIDVISIKAEKTGIIVCKNFNEINSELLEVFYSYMQKHPYIDLKFIILTEEISFIPDNIVKCCKLIRVPRPTRELYESVIKLKSSNEDEKISIPVNLGQITNIKNIMVNPFNEILCNKIIESILNIETLRFQDVRTQLYELLIYNLNCTNCIWYIVEELVKKNRLKDSDMPDIFIKIYSFLQYYNNNYRPIYHLESIIFYLVKKVHGL